MKWAVHRREYLEVDIHDPPWGIKRIFRHTSTSKALFPVPLRTNEVYGFKEASKQDKAMDSWGFGYSESQGRISRPSLQGEC